MTIKEAIQSFLKDKLVPTIHLAKVVSIDDMNMTCEVDLSIGPNVPGVRIRAQINETLKGLLIKPKVDSVVLIARIEGKIESSVIIAYSEIDEFNGVTEGEFKINGDSDGGLVKIQPLNDNLDAIKNYLNSLEQAIITGLNSVGAGTAANGAAGATAFQTSMSPVQLNFQNMESNKNKHGS